MAKKPTKGKPDEQTQQPTTALALASTTSLTLPKGVTVKRHITLPSLAIKLKDQAEIVTFMDPMRVSKIKGKPDSEGKTRDPATIATVGRHAGEHNSAARQGTFTLIIPSVVKANLERDYPVDGDGVVPYIGKSFFIRNLGKRTESQRYNDFEIFEVDVPTAGAAEAAQ